MCAPIIFGMNIFKRAGTRVCPYSRIGKKQGIASMKSFWAGIPRPYIFGIIWIH